MVHGLETIKKLNNEAAECMQRDLTCRRQFEQWICRPPYNRSFMRYMVGHDCDGDYVDEGVNLAWHAWVQAWNIREGITQ